MVLPRIERLSNKHYADLHVTRGSAGEEVVDENFNFSNARRRSNSSSYSNHKELKTKFEINELEPVFDESLHGPEPEDETALFKTETSSSTGSSGDDEKEQN